MSCVRSIYCRAPPVDISRGQNNTMAGMREESEPLPALVELARRFPGALSSLKSVQKVVHAVQAGERKSTGPGKESFVELLQPSPTVHEALIMLAAQGEGGSDECEFGEVGEMSALLRAIKRLDEVLRTVEVKLSLEARLGEFEEEIGMPAEGRGGLLRLVLSPGTTVEGLVMLLATYVDVETTEFSTSTSTSTLKRQ